MSMVDFCTSAPKDAQDIPEQYRNNIVRIAVVEVSFFKKLTRLSLTTVVVDSIFGC